MRALLRQLKTALGFSLGRFLNPCVIRAPHKPREPRAPRCFSLALLQRLSVEDWEYAVVSVVFDVLHVGECIHVFIRYYEIHVCVGFHVNGIIGLWKCHRAKLDCVFDAQLDMMLVLWRLCRSWSLPWFLLVSPRSERSFISRSRDVGFVSRCLVFIGLTGLLGLTRPLGAVGALEDC